jgi:hypothetical protein
VFQENQSHPIPANGGDGAGSGTKVAARTDAAIQQTPIPGGQSAGQDRPRRPPIILTENVDVSGPFSDCSSCPLMFIPRRALDGLEGTDLAISMSEITIAQWNICAEDGACPEYGVSSTRKNQSLPVTGIEKEGANQYASWLSRVTGQTYSVALSADGGCVTTVPGRVASNRWAWSDDLANEECPNSKSDGKISMGFLVTRRVEPGS